MKERPGQGCAIGLGLLGVIGAADTAHVRAEKIVVWPAEGDRYGIDLF
jgi:hypothetical protein